MTGHASFWACCAAPPPPKPKKEKKEKEKKEKKPKKEKKTKKDKFDERHNLPDGFQCNGGDEVNAVVIGDRGPADGDYMDRHPPEGTISHAVICNISVHTVYRVSVIAVHVVVVVVIVCCFGRHKYNFVVLCQCVSYVMKF